MSNTTKNKMDKPRENHKRYDREKTTHQKNRENEPKKYHSHKLDAKDRKPGIYLDCAEPKKCGGCTYKRESYKEQLKAKQRLAEANIGKYCKVDKIIGMENPFFYRNKVHAVFSYNKGKITSGTYEEKTHNVVPIQCCKIEDQVADAIIGTVRTLLKDFKIKIYDEDTGYGLFRHLLIRRGVETGEVMVVFVLGSPIMPAKNNFVKALLKAHPEITTIVLNVNDKKTSMVLGDKESVLYGKGYIEDVLCGVRFRLSSKSFYQINHTQTEILYNLALEYANLTGKERVIDAYCGIGTIGLIASSRAKEVISVELNRDAVKDAIVNAKSNQIKNVRFYQNDAGRFMVGMAEQGEKADVVLMDPPRAGSDEAFLSSVVTLSPQRVIYVSCNPVTLGRDLEYLTTHGYTAVKARPVDMFPWSDSLECVVSLVKTR